jgi:hypothetical protein
VQNKLHYAVHGHTTAKVVYKRADAQQPFMGLTKSNAGTGDLLIEKLT